MLLIFEVLLLIFPVLIVTLDFNSSNSVKISSSLSDEPPDPESLFLNLSFKSESKSLYVISTSFLLNWFNSVFVAALLILALILLIKLSWEFSVSWIDSRSFLISVSSYPEPPEDPPVLIKEITSGSKFLI